MFFTVGALLACQQTTDVVSFSAPSHSGVQAVAALSPVVQLTTAQSPAAVPSVVGLAGMNTSVTAGITHCNGLCCAGSCCPACSAAMIVERWTTTNANLPHFDIPYVDMPFPSTGSTGPYRPPRLIIRATS
jgi:hypothetical protein